MKGLAIFLNVCFPGVGSFVVNKPGQGVAQIILYVVGIILCFTFIGAVVGIPLCIGVWIWGVVTAASTGDRPQQQIVIMQNVTHGTASHVVNPPNGTEVPTRSAVEDRSGAYLDATPTVKRVRSD
jgi:TM2 domain-containing membrane protein YozV